MSLAATLPQLPLPTTVTFDLMGDTSFSTLVVMVIFSASNGGCWDSTVGAMKKTNEGRKNWGRLQKNNWGVEKRIIRSKWGMELNGEGNCAFGRRSQTRIVSINVCNAKSGGPLYTHNVWQKTKRETLVLQNCHLHSHSMHSYWGKIHIFDRLRMTHFKIKKQSLKLWKLIFLKFYL